jgi:hypothetical protein
MWCSVEEGRARFAAYLSGLVCSQSDRSSNEWAGVGVREGKFPVFRLVVLISGDSM